jgi:hypothetical protein
MCLDDTSSRWLNRTSGWWTKNYTQFIAEITTVEYFSIWLASAKETLLEALNKLDSWNLKILALIRSAASKIMDFPSLYLANFTEFLDAPSPRQLRLYLKGKSWYLRLPPYLIPLFRIPVLSTGFSLVQQSARSLDSYLALHPSVSLRLHRGLLSLLRILSVSIQRLLVVFSLQTGESNVLNVLFYCKKVVNAVHGIVRTYAQMYLYPFQRLLVVAIFGLLCYWIPNWALQCVTILLYCVILTLAFFLIYWVYETWLKIICRFFALTLRISILALRVTWNINCLLVIYPALKIVLHTYFYLEQIKKRIVGAWRNILRLLYILCVIIALRIKRTNVSDFTLVTLGTIFLFLNILYDDLEFYLLQLLNFYALARMKINNCFLFSSFSFKDIPEDKKIIVFVKNLENQTKVYIVSPTILVSDFLFLIKTNENYSQELSLTIIFGCKSFHPYCKLNDLDVQDGSTLTLTLLLCGGGPKKKIKTSNQNTPQTPKKGTTLGSPTPIKGPLQTTLNPFQPLETLLSHEEMTTDTTTTQPTPNIEKHTLEEIIENQAVEIEGLKDKLSSFESILSQILENVTSKNTDKQQTALPLLEKEQRLKDKEKIMKHTINSPYYPHPKKKLFFESAIEESSKSVNSPLSKQEEKLESRTHDFDLDKEIHFVLGNEEQQRKFKKKTVDTKCDLDVVTYDLKDPFQEWWEIFRYEIQSSGLIGHTEQIEWLFKQKMSPSIRLYFQRLNTGEKLKLKDMIVIVLSNYNKAPKDSLDYEEELNAISKTTIETVGSYYLRLTNLAEKAKVNDDRKLRKIYVRGLVPQSLFNEVNKDIDNNTTFEEAHALAILAESKYFEMKQYQQHHRTDTTKPKKEENPKSQNNTNENNKNKNKIKKTNNRKSNTSSKEWGECYFCGKKHNWKECQALNPYYKPHELEILKLVGKAPQKREKWPDQPLTKETPWIKILLEKKDNHTSSKVATKSTEETTKK